MFDMVTYEAMNMPVQVGILTVVAVVAIIVLVTNRKKVIGLASSSKD